MGVYIKNLKKPKDCYECPIAKSYLDCLMEKKYVCPIGHTDDCPLIEIVTCGECKWYNPWHANHTNIDGNHCRNIDRPMKPTDFCSYGERRSE